MIIPYLLIAARGGAQDYKIILLRAAPFCNHFPGKRLPEAKNRCRVEDNGLY